jgi:hypothetical protein
MLTARKLQKSGDDCDSEIVGRYGTQKATYDVKGSWCIGGIEYYFLYKH